MLVESTSNSVRPINFFCTCGNQDRGENLGVGGDLLMVFPVSSLAVSV